MLTIALLWCREERGLRERGNIFQAFDQIPGFDVKSIKLGNGIVGKTTNAILGLFTLMGVVAFRLPPEFLMYLAAGCVGIFVFYFIAVIFFAKKYPNIAVLEGAELIAWRQMDMASSDKKIIDATANTSPKQLEEG